MALIRAVETKEIVHLRKCSGGLKIIDIFQIKDTIKVKFQSQTIESHIVGMLECVTSINMLARLCVTKYCACALL